MVLVFSTILGSSVPDLDTPTGGLWHKIPAGSIISRIVHPAFIGGHRHLSHSIIGIGIFTGLFYLLLKLIHLDPVIQNFNFIMQAFVVGYIAHIFADMFTEEGVPLLFPFDYHFGIPPNPFEKVRIKTGHWFENLIVYPLVNLAIFLVVYIYIKK
jgi:inner membrane protein